MSVISDSFKRTMMSLIRISCAVCVLLAAIFTKIYGSGSPTYRYGSTVSGYGSEYDRYGSGYDGYGIRHDKYESRHNVYKDRYDSYGSGHDVFKNKHDRYGNGHIQFGAKPFQFGYVADSHDGIHFRKEKGDSRGDVIGSYGYKDNKGLFRRVDYVADASGFHARVKTNEPGVGKGNPADVQMDVQPPPRELKRKYYFGHDISGSGESGELDDFDHFKGIPDPTRYKKCIILEDDGGFIVDRKLKLVHT